MASTKVPEQRSNDRRIEHGSSKLISTKVVEPEVMRQFPRRPIDGKIERSSDNTRHMANTVRATSAIL